MNKKLLEKIFIVFISIFLSINFTFAQSDVYKNVGSNLDNSTSTTISNTSTGGLVETARYLGLMVAAFIITLVIFKYIEGAVLKGTYDNIYDQQKGNKILKNTTISFLIFIFVNLLFTYINPDYGSWIFNTSTSVTPKSTIDGGVCVVDQDYNNKSVEDEIKQDEESGQYKPWVYMDSTGHPTIGWGFNLAQSGASQFMQQAGIDNNTIGTLLSSQCKNVSIKDTSSSADKSCPKTITQSQADAIFNTELAAHKNNIYNWAGGQDKYNALPINIQKALLNIMYNVGPDSMSKFVKMKSAVNSKDWTSVASELQKSTYCSQVGQRCGRLVGLILGECATINSANSSSLYGNNQNRCNIINSIKPSDLVDLKTYGISCTSSYGCLIKKDVAEDLKKLDAAYYEKFKTHISIASAYRSDVQQADTCRSVQGTLCAKPCSQGGGGSNHSFGDAVDFSNETIGNCSKSGSCSNVKFNWLRDPSGGGQFNLYNKLTDDNPHFSRTGN